MTGNAISVITLESPQWEAAQERLREFEELFDVDQIIQALGVLTEEARTAPLAKRFSNSRPPFSTYPPIHISRSWLEINGIRTEEQMKRSQLASNFHAIQAKIAILFAQTKEVILDLEAAKID